MSWTADPRSGRKLSDWYVECDGIAWDGYNFKGSKPPPEGDGYAKPTTKDADPNVLYGPLADFCEAKGIRAIIREHGCAREKADTAGVKRTAWFQRVKDSGHTDRFEAWIHYENGISDGRCEFAIRGEKPTLDVWTSFRESAPVDHTAEIAALREQLAALAATLIEYQAQVAAAAAVLASANTGVAQTEIRIADVEAQIAALGG
jgi:hypothetical protein